MKPVRILVVDDNEDHRFFITRALREAGGDDLDIDTVGDGEEALDYLHRRAGYEGQARPHMILLDLRMPRVSGIEVLRDIKHDDALKRIPVSVLTSSDRPDDIEEAYLSGTNSYLIKRSNPTELGRVLKNVSEYWTDLAVLPHPPN